MDDHPYPWVSRSGFMEARLIQETAEDILFFWRCIGVRTRGAAKVLNKQGFQQQWRMKTPTEEAAHAETF